MAARRSRHVYYLVFPKRVELAVLAGPVLIHEDEPFILEEETRKLVNTIVVLAIKDTVISSTARVLYVASSARATS